MTSQKAENLLNLSLDATEEEREKSLELSVGYDPIERVWDLIIKYSGDLASVRNLAEAVVELQNEYAVITIKEALIERLTEIPEVEYIEKPKRLFFQISNGKRVSCINELQPIGTLQPTGTLQIISSGLYGNGVLIGIIDSGIDYTNTHFRNADGTTRIRALWDQSLSPGEGRTPPDGYVIGAEYTSEQINQALKQTNPLERFKIVPSVDNSGHGTAVAGIAAGNGAEKTGTVGLTTGNEAEKAGAVGLTTGNGEEKAGAVGLATGNVAEQAGVAPASELIVVKLGTPRQEGFPRTTELMQGLDYVIRKALEYRMPVAVNISFGNTYGSHDGASLLERFIDDISNKWKSCICIGTGNEAASAGHTSGTLKAGIESRVQLAVQNQQTTLSVQLWKEYTDIIEISIVTPTGVTVGPLSEVLGSQRFTVGQTEILLYYGKPSPYSTAQEIYIDMLPRESYITGGVWQIVLTPRKIVSGQYELWLPGESVLNRGTGFLYPTETTTLTIPSTASRAISVGAYDALTFGYADFSGRGPIRGLESDRSGLFAKPDLVAPGVDVVTTAVGGGYTTVSGTSFATPFVTGSAALLMEWGIVKGNDPYLYGEKVKAYLRRGARELPGFMEYPNEQVGYGRLCVRESIPD